MEAPEDHLGSPLLSPEGIRETDEETRGPLRERDEERRGPLREREEERRGPLRERDEERRGPLLDRVYSDSEEEREYQVGLSLSVKLNYCGRRIILANHKK